MSSSLSLRNRIRIVLLFMIAGPALGSLPFVIPLMLIGLHSGFLDPYGHPHIVKVLLVSYLIGVLPAIACGGMYQWIVARLARSAPSRKKIQTVVLGILTGLLTGLMTTGILLFIQRREITQDALVFHTALLFCCMLASTLCALIARRWTDRPDAGASLHAAPETSHT